MLRSQTFFLAKPARAGIRPHFRESALGGIPTHHDLKTLDAPLETHTVRIEVFFAGKWQQAVPVWQLTTSSKKSAGQRLRGSTNCEKDGLD